jgi:hypothetical protein
MRLIQVEAYVKRFLIVSCVIALTLPLLAQGRGAGTRTGPAGGRGGGQEGVGALGQNVRRPPAPTGAVPRLPDGTVDLSGVWVGGGSTQDIEREGGIKPGTLESLMTPQAKQIFAAREEKDNPQYHCLPSGIPRASPYPFRFVQMPTHKKATHIFILQEGNIHSFRQVFMDAKHPAELDPTWFGHSVGRWEGDTLVIDTVGFNDKTWWDNRGFPHTEQLHTIERWTRTDLGHMNVEVIIEDPGAYTKPFTAKFTARLSNPGDELMEYICQENNQFGVAGGLFDKQ